MCGISGLLGNGWKESHLFAMIEAQRHRGPNGTGSYFSEDGEIGLGHNRLSIIDLSNAGSQPMSNYDQTIRLVYNGEIYNYVELKSELSTYPYVSQSDSEVILAAYEKWGIRCVEKFVGMFAFIIWDERKKQIFAVRDRFGVKPLYYWNAGNGNFALASEIKALHVAGCPLIPNVQTWSTYLSFGLYDHSESTFWKDIQSLSPGHYLLWNLNEGITIKKWYDIADTVIERGLDQRSEDDVIEELYTLLLDSIKLRFRADVNIGICLSGGLDSSLLAAIIQQIYGHEHNINAFSFYCNNPDYDELPWMSSTVERTGYNWHKCLLSVNEVDYLTRRVQSFQDEPFGGFPTLGMAHVHDCAKENHVVVLLDGNGMDEGWAGYEYYKRAEHINPNIGTVQGAVNDNKNSVLLPDFAAQAQQIEFPTPFKNAVQNLQYRDIRFTKIPRAMRFADRVSMMYSRELREPFLDHRILELGLGQSTDRKIRNGLGKHLPRVIAHKLVPEGIAIAPKRPVQTPQREWLQKDLAAWADNCIENALTGWGYGWLDAELVRAMWKQYQNHGADNSFPIWQWINLGLMQ